MYSDREEAYNEEKVNSTSKGKLISTIVVLVFIVGIFGVAGLHILVDDKDFSESENRVLAQMPRLSWSSLTDGSFMDDFEAYLSDQFPYRDKLISVKTFSDRVLGKNKENGTYIGKDGFLFDSQSAYDEDKVKEITDAILKFSKKNKKLKKAFILAPNSSYIYADKLPDYLVLPSQKEQIENIYALLDDDSILKLDLCTQFEKLREKSDHLLYYKTDHHWTTRAAKAAFNTLNSKWQLSTSGTVYTGGEIKPKFSYYTVSTTFQGTLSSSAGVHDTNDEVEICVPKSSEGTYVVELESQGEKTASLFFSDKLKSKNHYEVFLGGNYDKVIISTVSKSENTLLLIKDSYANCMIPMLTPYFNKIVVLDPRYLTDSLDSILKENDFTHVLFLYNLNTLLEDGSLAECLAS